MYYAAGSLAESTTRETLEDRLLVLNAFNRRFFPRFAAVAAAAARKPARAPAPSPAAPSELQLQLANRLRKGEAGGGAGAGAGAGAGVVVALSEQQRAATVSRLKVVLHAKYCTAAPPTVCTEYHDCLTYRLLWPHLNLVRRVAGAVPRRATPRRASLRPARPRSARTASAPRRTASARARA
jgi:hypothetical protein